MMLEVKEVYLYAFAIRICKLMRLIRMICLMTQEDLLKIKKSFCSDKED